MRKESWLFTVYERFLVGLVSALSFLIFILLYKVFRYRYTVVSANISNAFPDEFHRHKSLVKGFYKHLADLLVEPILFMLGNDNSRRRLANYTNMEVLDQLYERGGNVIAFASHCGNWEYLIDITKVTSYTTYTAYTPISNPRLNRYVLRLRSYFGVHLISKSKFYREALLALRKKEDPALVVVIADQRPAPGSGKYYLDFLNQPTCVQLGAERLAIGSGATVVFIECVKTARFRYNYTFHLIADDIASCQPMDITKKYYALLEANIRKTPGNWLWSHKRWKPMLMPVQSVAQSLNETAFQ